MKRKDYIKPELAMVKLELQQMIALSGQLNQNEDISDPNDIGSRDNGFFF